MCAQFLQPFFLINLFLQVFFLSGNDIFAQIKNEGVIFLKLVKANILCLVELGFIYEWMIPCFKIPIKACRKFLSGGFWACLLLGISLITVNPQMLTAQSRSIVPEYKTRLSENLFDLGGLYCFSDPAFYPGKVKFVPVENAIEKYAQLNFKLFPEIASATANYLQFLNELPFTQKQNLLRLFSYYEEQLDGALKTAGLPNELKYLAPAFSAMDTNAKNWDGKAGIFQLTHFQAVLNGLQINKLLDERLNENAATIAFTRVMHQNFKSFDSPEMAVLAYYFGNVRIKNALYLAGENAPLNNVLKRLPDFADHFIALFQATAIFLNVNKFKPTIHPLAKKNIPDTVQIFRQLHFQQITDVLGISINELRFLNPQFRLNIVPGNENPTKLILPNGKWDDFVLWQDSIYNRYDSTLFKFTVQTVEYPPSPTRQYLHEPIKDLEIEGKTKIQYRLKTGDVLGIIAENFDVRVADLKYWNNIYNERKIQAGKTLDIFVDEDQAEYYLSLSTLQTSPNKISPIVERFKKNSTLKVFEDLNSAKKIVHIVKNGESPFTIAKKYEGVTPDEILEWNKIDDARKIQIGQKLIVFLK